MLYRPKFCCNCGEKIEREEWRLWTSRRFCALCETEYKPYDLIPRVIVVVAGLLTLFGLSGMFRGSERGSDSFAKPNTAPTQKLKPATLLSSSETNANSQQAVANENGVAASPNSNNGPVNTENGEQPAKGKRTSDEAVYYCGAITKKGTPCTRRVRNKGYCWQHAKIAASPDGRF